MELEGTIFELEDALLELTTGVTEETFVALGVGTGLDVLGGDEVLGGVEVFGGVEFFGGLEFFGGFLPARGTMFRPSELPWSPSSLLRSASPLLLDLTMSNHWV